MDWQLTPYTLPLLVATVLAFVGAGIAWRQREGRLEVWALFVQVSLGLWSLFTLLTVSATSLQWKRFWFALFLPTIPLLVVTTSLFTVHFVGRRDWITRPRIAALVVFPVATLVLTLTNWRHGLFLVDVGVDRSGEFALLTYEWGVGIFVVSGLSYAVALGYNALLARKILRSRNVYRRISAVIFLAALVTGGVTVLSLTKVSPFPHFMLVPYTYLLVGVVLLLGTGSVTFARALPVDRFLSVAGSRFDNTVPLARDFVLEVVDNGILVLDDDDRIVDVNSTAKRMLGLDRPIGNRLSAVTRPELVLDSGSLDGVLRGREPVHELDDEVWVQTPDGKRCYQVTITALGDGEDSSAHVVLLHDITDRKRREERLEDQKETLRARKQQLEHQNERLDQFAGIVSHDLRNPLNVASGYLELLDARLDDDDTAAVDAEELREMERATERMGAIIDDALTLAREGKAVTETAPVDLGETASAAWDTVDTTDATLAVETDATVEADRGRLRTIFENCFRNAVEHGRDDATVTVGDLNRPDTTGFYVADDGPGIPEERRDEVLDHGFTTSEDGTGFGLAIVTEAASAHGWNVRVTDGEAGGARFEFTDVSGPAADDPSLDGVLDGEDAERETGTPSDNRPANDE